MKALVLAAGRGVRLRPFTDRHPKALATIDGMPLLEIILRRLHEAGVREVVINLHHHGDQIEAWIARHGAFGMRVAFSREATLLDTGGGLKQAGWFFDDERPFLVHNVDVLSDIDLRALIDAQARSGALATLAVRPRPTSRPLLFDAAGRLCGRRGSDGDRLAGEPRGAIEALGFCGIHAVSPALLARLEGEGAFSIIDAYLACVARGETIVAHRVDGARWRDAGRPADLRPL